MKKEFSYEDRRFVEDCFDNEFNKVFLNLKARLRNAPPEVRDEIIREKEKAIMKNFIYKYM